MMMRYRIACFFFFFSLICQAQYPQGYFRNPLGIPMQLVANFGEVRSNHFHMGLDLRTNRSENLPVYAAADGYVSRVVVEPGGYGRAIEISHPNGYSTLYAHLNEFYPALQQFLEEKQYREEKWEQEISLEPGRFPVSKGQFIARSGNTGASEGPHLHFEIRETKTGANLNPQLFGFPAKDNIAPLVYRLFLYDRNYSTYSVDPTEISVKGGKGSYRSRDSVVYTGSPRISLGLSAEDLGNTSSFRYGVYAAELWVDSVMQFAFTLDKLNYAASRYVNAAIDYKKRVNNRSVVQHLSRLPGNHMNIYTGAGEGLLTLQDTSVHQVMVIVRDVAGNESKLAFKLAWDPSRHEERFFTQQTEKLLPNRHNTFSRENITIDFPVTALYDTLHFFHSEVNTGHNDQPMHQLHYPFVPLHDPYTVSVKWEQPGRDAAKLIWRLGTPGSAETQRPKLEQGRITGSFDRFGMLSLEYDTVAPQISPVGWKSGSAFAKTGAILINVKDELSYVSDFRAELDGKWLMFARKGNTFTYRFDEHCSLGQHELKIRIADLAGNETVRTYNFELKEKLPVKKKPVRKKKRR